MTLEPASFPLQEHLGMTIGSPTAGVGTASIDVGPDLHNPNGVVHGAVLFAMADTSMGAATMSALDAGLACASIEVQLRFLRPIASGRIVAETTVIKRGASRRAARESDQRCQRHPHRHRRRVLRRHPRRRLSPPR